jgi:predicted ester cyclase
MIRVVMVAFTLVTSLLGGIVSPSSAQGDTPTESCPTTSADEQEAIARRWFEDALNGADLSVLDQILSDEFTYHSGSLPEMDAGQLAASVLGPVLVGFPDVHYTIEEVFSGGDAVALIWRAEGTQMGGFQGYAPSGKPAVWTGINVYRFECGRVAEVWAEFDALGRLRQMGAIATPTP